VGRIILFWLEKFGTNNRNDGDGEGEANAGAPQVGPLRLLNLVANGLAKADPNERWDLEEAAGFLTKQATHVRLEHSRVLHDSRDPGAS
jgi:hypothetical protein